MNLVIWFVMWNFSRSFFFTYGLPPLVFKLHSQCLDFNTVTRRVRGSSLFLGPELLLCLWSGHRATECEGSVPRIITQKTTDEILLAGWKGSCRCSVTTPWEHTQLIPLLVVAVANNTQTYSAIAEVFFHCTPLS